MNVAVKGVYRYRCARVFMHEAGLHVCVCESMDGASMCVCVCVFECLSTWGGSLVTCVYAGVHS